MEDRRRVEEHQKPRSYTSLIVGLVVVAGLAAALLVGYQRLTARAKQMRYVSHAKSISLSLKTYAIDHEGAYPELGQTYTKWLSSGKAVTVRVTNATSAFDVLVPEYMPSEKIFWCSARVGPLPIENEELRAGENHWGLSSGLTDSSSGGYPLVFENAFSLVPVPKWKNGRHQNRMAGTTWGDRCVVIGYNDGSASLEKVTKSGTFRLTSDPFAAPLPNPVTLLNP